MTKNFKLREVLPKHPEIREMIEEVYGEITSTVADPIFEVSMKSKDFLVVVCDNDFLTVSGFGFDMDRFQQFLGVDDLTSVILINPEIGSELGFGKEFSALKEITFKEVKSTNPGEMKTVFITKQIPLKRNDFYETPGPSAR